MKRWLHGWWLFFDMYSLQRRKVHGAGKAPVNQAVFVALCGRMISLGGLPRKHPMIGRPWRWWFGAMPIKEKADG